MRSTSRLIALALTFASAPGVVRAQDAPAVEPPQEPDDPRLHDTAVVVGFETYRFHSQDGSRMAISGPSFGVSYTVGHRFGFALRGAFALPVRGTQHVPGTGSASFQLGDVYTDQRGSYDALVGFYRRYELDDTTTLFIGAGAHARLVGLTDSEFQPVQLIQGGFAAYARLDCELSEHFFFGAEAYAGIDPLDFVDHRFRAVVAAPMSLSLVVGAHR